MKKTVLITGSSSGFGKLSAKLFQQKGWNVAATMRTPEKEHELTKFPGVTVYPLDVTDQQSIRNAVDQIIGDFGTIDVLINNAGFAAAGVLEAATDQAIRQQLETNLFGLIKVTQAVLPQMRKQRDGIIINVSSVAGLIGVPFNSLYSTSKFAVEGLTESLQYELNPLGIRVKLIEPTGYKTEFSGRSMDVIGFGNIEDYRSAWERFADHLGAAFSEKVEEVAGTIYEAATDGTERLRYLVGMGAAETVEARKAMGDIAFKQMLIKQTGI
jgi:NAD(P)-dependent dehydrogenase (short-subunit alcohol dehydrogenase family)